MSTAVAFSTGPVHRLVSAIHTGLSGTTGARQVESTSPFKMHSGNAISTFLGFKKVVLIAKILICTTHCKVLPGIIYSSLLLILYF